jgi:DnaJ-class molecular chaperone
MQNAGNSAGDMKGDVKFVFSIVNTTGFQRHGMDLIYKKQITLKEALTGFSFDLVHVNGKTLCLNNKTNRTIIAPHYKKVIPGLGMVRDGNTGNLIIEFDVAFPESLTIEQMDAIANIL